MKSHHRWVGTVLVVIALSVSSLANAASVSGQGTWETTLQGRDLDGNLSTAEAYYDISLNTTWLANANVASLMTWADANSWAAGLNPYGSGITGWRLPTVTDTGTPGCDFAYTGTDCGYNVDTATGEMAHMFYTTLGDKAYYDTSGVGPQAGWGLTNTGPFSNVQADGYWSATEYAPATVHAWRFDFGYGSQGNGNKPVGHYAWAVHPGDVGAPAVPVPAAVWLFGSGLIGLAAVTRRRHPLRAVT
jgi:hypothetical protein